MQVKTAPACASCMIYSSYETIASKQKGMVHKVHPRFTNVIESLESYAISTPRRRSGSCIRLNRHSGGQREVQMPIPGGMLSHIHTCLSHTRSSKPFLKQAGTICRGIRCKPEVKGHKGGGQPLRTQHVTPLRAHHLEGTLHAGNSAGRRRLVPGSTRSRTAALWWRRTCHSHPALQRTEISRRRCMPRCFA